MTEDSLERQKIAQTPRQVQLVVQEVKDRIVAQAQPATPGLQFYLLRTLNGQGADTTLFNPFTDTLTLVMYASLSPAVSSLAGLILEANFEILDARTNTVVVYEPREFGIGTGWSGFFASLGSATPHDWGLQWTAGDIFGFRAVAAMRSSQGEVDAFDVSDIKWFRLMDVFEL